MKWGIKMAEPASSAAGGLVGWKLIGGTTAALSVGAALAVVIVMCMTPPRSKREWAVALISTVVSSIGGGAAVARYFELQSWAHDPIGLVALFGLVFACGLPGWALVRALFLYLERSKEKDISQLVDEALAKKQKP